MSVFRVVQWSVDAPDHVACEQAVKAVAEHVESVHPATRAFRTSCRRSGPLPRWTFVAIFEFESATAWDNDPKTPSCEVAWAPIHRLARPGSFAMFFSSDPEWENPLGTADRGGSSEETGAPDPGGGQLRR